MIDPEKYRGKSKAELVEEIIELLLIIEEEKKKCEICKTAAWAEIERGKRERGATIKERRKIKKKFGEPPRRGPWVIE